MTRIERERHTVEQMIHLYCYHKEGNATLCADCKALIEYATARLEHCKFGNRKPTCHRCPVHCYSPRMRSRIRQVMRWAGPRMIFYHPISALRHLFD